MISYELSEEQEIIRSMIGELAAGEVRPVARRMDDAGAFDEGVLAALWSTQIIQSQASAELERSAVTNVLVLEELGAADASLALATAAAIGFACAIRDQGSCEQRAMLETHLQVDEYRSSAIAFMEPRFGSAAAAPETRARREGNTYVLQGRKAMVPVANRCSHFLVIAEADGCAEAFIVPRESRGVRVGNAGGTLGLRAAEMTEVTFEEVRVPLAMRLGGEQGADVQRILDSSRVALSAIMVGMNREIIAYVVPFAKDRRVDGMPLAQRQSVAFNIADTYIHTESMRWMTWKAAWQLDQGDSSTRQAQLAYSFAGEQTMIIADNALQVFGGHGYVRENPLEMWYRNARMLSVLSGVAGV